MFYVGIHLKDTKQFGLSESVPADCKSFKIIETKRTHEHAAAAAANMNRNGSAAWAHSGRYTFVDAKDFCKPYSLNGGRPLVESKA